MVLAKFYKYISCNELAAMLTVESFVQRRPLHLTLEQKMVVDMVF